jgi:glycosyltransferase involved in cell wall biosynthesis
LADVFFAIPGDIDTPTGGYAYDRRVLALLPGCGVLVEHLPLPGTFPFAPVPDLAMAGRALGQTPEDAVLLVDGLAYGALTDIVLKDLHRRFVALVHHPLALETGLTERRRRALVESERAALARAVAVVVTSPLTARILASEYDVPGSRITVAVPGTDPAARARGGGEPPSILAVGAVSPRKAYGVLVEAMAALKDLPWRLRILGATDRAPEEAGRVAAAIRAHHLDGRIVLEGARPAAVLEDAYAAADIFVMPSLFEGYGMVLAEAMARGLPIVCTTGGAAAETVPDAAAIKVTPGDAAALAHALLQVIDDEGLRAALAEASFAAGRQLPTWEDTARVVAGVLREAQTLPLPGGHR